MTSWREEKQPVQRVARLTVSELHSRWEEDRDGLQLLDVREQDEWDAGHIPGSIHVPYHDIRELPDELDAGRPVAVLCSSGQRAAVAASLLKRLGAGRAIHVVDGGVPRWEREGWPVER
jgi:rhodanese-related sulfurtransferase